MIRRPERAVMPDNGGWVASSGRRSVIRPASEEPVAAVGLWWVWARVCRQHSDGTVGSNQRNGVGEECINAGEAHVRQVQSNGI